VEEISAASQTLEQAIQKIGAAVYEEPNAPVGEAGPNPDAGPDVVDGEVKE